jgi:4-hydroxybenzoyl-CoA thioesterase
MATHEIAIQVRWSESDPAGIAFYPRFFEWYDIACGALFEAHDLPWPVIFPQFGIVGVPIVECGSKFSSPVRYGDIARVRSTIVWVKDKTFRVEHRISVGDRLCAEGFEVRAWVGRPADPQAPLRARPIPLEVVAKLTGDGAGRAEEGPR